MSARFTGQSPEEMSPEQRTLYDFFASGRRADSSAPFSLVDGAGRLQGPPAVWVLHPPLGNALEKLGAAIRYHLTLPARAREMVILMVGHHHRAPLRAVRAHEGGDRRGAVARRPGRARRRPAAGADDHRGTPRVRGRPAAP
ncbi:hypothetical protein [Actinomadura madurae]|uniref:hypothetical protein n=1 Tax=Actinomadura madurae TaxID=1993 RepID=UPI0020D21466|nr:hypothetical protein [Actinomadura madurae]MCP9969387.1 hypothetical protein [Actinomadura madurae]MCP9981850.1 hypothetical protein [Actinomadura madurae]